MTTNISTLPDRSRPSRAVAAEVRAEAARQGITQGQLAARMGVQQAWLSRRIGIRADVDITLEETLEMAKALRISPEGLLYAIRDSNPEPAD
jgi:transcriptional regulator with XRE-family HTH domain